MIVANVTAKLINKKHPNFWHIYPESLLKIWKQLLEDELIRLEPLRFKFPVPHSCLHKEFKRLSKMM